VSDSKGVFNGPQHAEEIQMLMKGDYKQFQLIGIDLTTVGPALEGGNGGLFEMEGNALTSWPVKYDEEALAERFTTTATQSLGKTLSPLYVKFNHKDNPWLPLSLSNNTVQNTNSPCGYCLTFGRFWIRVANASAGAKSYLLLTRGVSIYSPNLGPVVIGGYQAPTWQKLK
jgi:hypothetical protein